MGFIQPCFIRKNTPEIREKLEELGYKPFGAIKYDWNSGWGISVDNRSGEFESFDDNGLENIIKCGPPDYEDSIDCGTNEELFLALAALRDDTDMNQWFIYNSMDCIIEKLRTIDWFICDENSIEDFAFYDSLYLLCHKATVEELIEHFKEK